MMRAHAGRTSLAVAIAALACLAAPASAQVTCVGGGCFEHIRGLDGSASDPTYGFESDDNTGIFLSAPDTLTFGAAGFAGWSVTPHLVPVTDAAFSIGGYSTRVHNLYLKGNIKSGTTTTLTEATPTDVYQIDIAAGSYSGGRFRYCVFASDATDHQLRCASISWAAINKAGTETCTMSPAAPDQTNDGNAAAISVGTLTYAVTCVNTPANGVLFKIAATSSLTQTTLRAESRIDMLVAQLTVPE